MTHVPTGISMIKHGKYRAYINRNKTRRNLGVFGTLEEAIHARELAEKELT